MRRKVNMTDKPYNRCLACQHRIEKRCDGPRTSAMTLERWCEFMRAMKEANGLSNIELSEKSGVSIKTIERIMAMNCEQDIMRETARRIEDAIIGSSNQYPCYLAFVETLPNDTEKLNDALRDLERALAENKDYRSLLDNIHASHTAEIDRIRAEEAVKIMELRSQIEGLQREVDNLWEDNRRKGHLIDLMIENQRTKTSAP